MESTLSDSHLLVAKLDKHPWIKERIASMLDVVKNAQGDLRRADDAEERVIEEVRRMGQQALQAWATHRVGQSEQALRQERRASRQGKKNFAGTPRSGTLR
jgi:hypothetical protein